MAINNSSISSAESFETDFTHVHGHAQRLAANNCWGSSPPWFHPPHSPEWEHWSRGQHAAGESLAQPPVFWGGLWWKRFTGRGSALLEVWDINGNAFSVQQQAAEELFFIFLDLSHPQRKGSVKETHTRNISRKGGPEQLQSYPQRCSKPGNVTYQFKSMVKKPHVNWTDLMISSSTDKENQLTPNIPRSHRKLSNHRLNLWRSSCLLHKDIIIFTHKVWNLRGAAL